MVHPTQRIGKISNPLMSRYLTAIDKHSVKIPSLIIILLSLFVYQKIVMNSYCFCWF